MSSPPPMHISGPRAELVSCLREAANGWWHLAKDELHREALRGAERLEAGESSVQVGHTLYEVTDASAVADVTSDEYSD